MNRGRKIKAISAVALLLGSMAVLNVEVLGTEFLPDSHLLDAHASFLGEHSGDYAGYSVAGVGDVNGDGYDDILIGARFNDEDDTDGGQTYLVFGKATGWSMDIDLSDADASFIGENDYDWSGIAIAGAGDVNGDGYDDFLIGANGNNEGGTDAGQTYLFLGKRSGWSMDTMIYWADASFIGEASDDQSGLSVDGAGDLNGDGYDDIVIGAPANSEAANGAGQVYIIFGKATGWSRDTDLSAADASYLGEGPDDLAGNCVAGAGDVNGDGYDDIVVGAMSSNAFGYTDNGQAYIVFGKASGWTKDVSLAGMDASYWGEASYDYAGTYVAGAGDVNGDGYDDVVIGAPENDEVDDGAGQTYLVFGKPSGWHKDQHLSTVDASFLGEDYLDLSGTRVSGAGDINGDGYDDFMISAWGNDDGDNGAGQTYLFYGKASGWALDTELGDADASFWGEAYRDYSSAIAAAGDVNGGGLDDIMIGAYGNNEGGSDAGQTYLFFGEEVPPAPTEVEVVLSDDGSRVAIYWQAVPYFRTISGYNIHRSDDGLSYHPLGSVTGTTFSFVDREVTVGRTYSYVVTATTTDPDTESEFSISRQVLNEPDTDQDGVGDSYDGDDDGDGVPDRFDLNPLFPDPTSWSRMDVDLETYGVGFYGEDRWQRAGWSIAIAGDVNGDGYDDILIGAEDDDEGGLTSGQTFLIFGRGSGWPTDLNLSYADASFWGEYAGDGSGNSVAGAGDVNGDGYDDILIGAQNGDTTTTNAGKVHLIFGKESGWSVHTRLSEADASFWGEDYGDHLGWSVAGAGDVNGDGFDDIIMSSLSDDGGNMAGQTYLVLGRPRGWHPNTNVSEADASFWGEDADDRAGECIAGTGDVNGDGLDDFLIGALGDEDGGGAFAGQTYLVLGKRTGWAMDTDLSAADASFWGEDASDWTGNAVAGAGDVNGDGFDDILIGAQGDDDGGNGAGQVYMVFGKSTGWAMDTDLSAADASFWGEDSVDRAGSSVAGAGDVNGDGFDDIVIGAYGDEDGGGASYTGQTYVIFGRASGWSMDADLSSADASFWGENDGDECGYWVAGGGDVNGDGHADILMGAPYHDGDSEWVGKTYLIHRNVMPPVMNLSVALTSPGPGLKVRWDDSRTDPFLYGVYRGHGPGSLTRIALTSANSYIDTNVSTGVEYHYAVTCVCPLGGESPIVETAGIVADADTDNDGTGDLFDWDDDGDGVADMSDAFPLDRSETLDSDGDGLGNNRDDDDDNDGTPDASDPWPLLAINDIESIVNDINTTVSTLDIDLLRTTLDNILARLDQVRADISRLGSAMWVMEGNLSGRLTGLESSLTSEMDAMEATLLARMATDLAVVMGGLDTMGTSLRSQVDGMWSDYNQTSASDRTILVATVTTMWNGINSSMSGALSDILGGLGDTEANLGDKMSQLQSYLKGELDMDQQELVDTLGTVWDGLNTTLDGMDSALTGRLAELEAELTGVVNGRLEQLEGNLSGDLTALQDYIGLRMAQLELYIELANTTLHHHLDSVETDITDLRTAVTEDLTGIAAYLEGLSEDMTEEHQAIMDAIQSTSELMTSLNDDTMAELRAGLVDIGIQLVGLNETGALRKAEVIDILVAQLDEVNASISADLHQVETSLGMLTVLDTILTEVQKVDNDVKKTQKDVKDDKASGWTMDVAIIIILLVIIGLMAYVLLRGGRKEEDLPIEDVDDRRA